MKLLWVTDPWETLDHPRDTTLRLIEEARALGHDCHWCDIRSIRLAGTDAVLDALPVRSIAPGRGASSFNLGKPAAVHPSEFGRLFYRTDPPVDLTYLHPLQILALGLSGKRRTEVVNPLSILFESNEKLEGARLGDLMPPGVAAARREDLERFGRRLGLTVCKPLHQAQSRGVTLLDWRSPSNRKAALARLAEATDGFRRPVLLQRYLAGISEGEQRLWFLDGKLLAHVRKRPKTGEFRIDMDSGGTLIESILSREDRRAATRIGKHLRARGIRMAAVDLIESLVTDFNFTSPGLLCQMEALLGENLARPVIRSIVRPFRR